jgi:hypothetical protein
MHQLLAAEVAAAADIRVARTIKNSPLDCKQAVFGRQRRSQPASPLVCFVLEGGTDFAATQGEKQERFARLIGFSATEVNPAVFLSY